LWSEGFRSGLVSDTYHMHKPGYGFSRGFDDLVWLRGQEGDPYIRDPRIKVDIEPFYKSRTGEPKEADQIRQYLTNRHDWQTEDDQFTPRVMGHALDWLKRQDRKENLFLWVDSFCPHEPWDPPDRFLKQVAPAFSGKKLILPTPGDAEGYLDAAEVTNIQSLYAAVVAFVDHCVGNFLNEIKRMGLYDDTMIVIATDHGEPFGDHGIVRKIRPWAYEELAHTFLMIREPGGQGVQQVNSYVQLTDLTATILDHLGIASPPQMTSRSLMPLILGKEEKIRDFAVCCHYGKSLNVRHDDWSYHYFLDGDAKQKPGSKLTKDGPSSTTPRTIPPSTTTLSPPSPTEHKPWTKWPAT